MSNHYDYMPKPDGWVPEPYPLNPSPADSLPKEADEAELAESGQPTDKKEELKAEGNKESSKIEPIENPNFEDTTPAERRVTLFANILSWICVPLIMPVYGIILIFSLSYLALNPFHTKLTYTLIVFGTTFVFPMLMVILLKKLGMIDDIGLNGRKERLIPYIITIICLAATGWFLWFKSAPLWVAMFYAGGALAGLINMIINFRWKISAHAAGIAGIVAMLIQITKEGFPLHSMTLWIVGSILLAGLLGSARIWLGRHTLMQVLAGSAVGFLCVWSLSLI